MAGLSFSDLDTNLQRSVFAAISILCIVLCVCLIKFVHYAFIVITALASGFMAYKLFLEPRLKKHKKIKAPSKKKSKDMPNALGVEN